MAGLDSGGTRRLNLRVWRSQVGDWLMRSLFSIDSALFPRASTPSPLQFLDTQLFRTTIRRPLRRQVSCLPSASPPWTFENYYLARLAHQGTVCGIVPATMKVEFLR